MIDLKKQYNTETRKDWNFVEGFGTLAARFGSIEYLAWLEQKVEDQLEKVIEIISIHDDGDGSYCDTGADMEWACRSECVDKAIKRLRKHFKVMEFN